MTIAITEIMRRTTQGRTEPYLCRGDNGLVYFVKGRALPRREIVAEWIAANLGAAIGLKLPPFDLAEVPPELVAPPLGAWLSSLGAGYAFASERVEATELTLHHADVMSGDERALIAAFDYWVRNMDRTLSQDGGNPNLLWKPATEGGEVCVIDHNLAFERAFAVDEFVATHIFRDDFKLLASDFLAREHVRQKLLGALPAFEDACARIPDEWRFIDPEQTMQAQWTEGEFRQVLLLCQNDNFWDLAP